MTEVWRALWLIAKKDLRSELRNKQTLVEAFLFSVIAVVLGSVAFAQSSSSAAAALFWVVNLFSGVVVASGLWANEGSEGALQGLLLKPIPRASIFLGKTLSTFVVLVVTNVVVIPVVLVLFNLSLSAVHPILLAIVLAALLGVSAVMSIFGALSVQSSTKDIALTIATFPLLSPVLLASVVATKSALTGAGADELWGWFASLMLFVFVFVALGAALFDFLLDE